MKETDWAWYWSIDGENYQGMCPTRESAIEEAKASTDRNFEIIEALAGKVPSPPRAEDLLEWWGDQNEDCWGEDGYQGFVSDSSESAAALAKLDALLETWWKEHQKILPTAWAFEDSRNHEVIVQESVVPHGE